MRWWALIQNRPDCNLKLGANEDQKKFGKMRGQLWQKLTTALLLRYGDLNSRLRIHNSFLESPDSIKHRYKTSCSVIASANLAGRNIMCGLAWCGSAFLPGDDLRHNCPSQTVMFQIGKSVLRVK